MQLCEEKHITVVSGVLSFETRLSLDVVLLLCRRLACNGCSFFIVLLADLLYASLSWL